MVKQYMKLMRVHHYIKNFLVFVALICSGEFFVKEKFFSGLVGFVSFCMISSVIYIINDICDRDKDCRHHTKRYRPIASGTISSKKALILAVILLVIAIVCNASVFDVFSSILLLTYFMVNLAYSLGLKNIPIVDISILVSGFLIRIMYGAIITDITISNWLYLTVIAAAFYFALGKRRNELRKCELRETRNVLRTYPIEFLDKNMYVCLTLVDVFYALWSMDENTVAVYGNEYLIFTVPIVLLITMKYSMDVESDSDGDPVEVLLNDKVLIMLGITYLAVMFIILYL